MTFGRDDFLYSQNFATDRTVTTLGQACAFTSGFYRCVNCYGVRYPVNRFCLCRAAYHAGIGLDAFRFAGGLCCNYTIIPGMRQKSNGFFLCVAAAGAGTGFLSLLSTGSRLRLNPCAVVMTQSRNYLCIRYRITFATVNRLTAIFRTVRFFIDRIIAFPRMTGCIKILRLCISTSITGSLLASLICTRWRNYSLPFAKSVAQSRYRFCITVAAATACESLYPCCRAGRLLLIYN